MTRVSYRKEPTSTSSATLTAATTHKTTATVAIATRDYCGYGPFSLA
jgi:hypothetical protein